MTDISKNAELQQSCITAVIASAFSDAELENMINYWLDHYTANGDSHYSDTKDWRIREIYWDKIVDRVIEDVNIEMTDSEIEKFCDRLADL
jgi:predicted metallo-beta-lactamase superfamily hydrolase